MADERLSERTMSSKGLPIAIGYAWRQRIAVSCGGEPLVMFPVGSEFKAEVRLAKPADTLIATLTTGGGHLVRVDDSNLDITIPAEATAELSPGVALLDLVRTDSDPDDYQHVMLRIDVIEPTTRA